MKTPTIYSYEVIHQVPRFGQVFHLLRNKFTICDILLIGDIVITGPAQEDADLLVKISDFLNLNKSRDPNNKAKLNWNMTAFDKYWRDLKELQSLLIYYFDTTSDNKFRKFNDCEWFFCYHICDNTVVELYTPRKDVVPFITKNYEVKSIEYPGTISGSGDLINKYVFE